MLESSKYRHMMWDFATHIRHMFLANHTYISGTSQESTSQSLTFIEVFLFNIFIFLLLLIFFFSFTD